VRVQQKLALADVTFFHGGRQKKTEAMALVLSFCFSDSRTGADKRNGNCAGEVHPLACTCGAGTYARWDSCLSALGIERLL
jgi:hypothetical protein